MRTRLMSAVSCELCQTSSACVRRIVVAESCLDPALRLGRVAGLERALRDEPDPSAGALGGQRSGEPGGPASDHENVKGEPLGHDEANIPPSANATH